MPAVTPPRVFISATTGDLGTVRRIIRDALLRIDCLPVEQSDFPPDYRTVTEFLASEVSRSDALIHVVGRRYGAEPDPATLPPGSTPRSYTQLEYDTALRLRKKVYTLICADDFPYDACEPESDLKVLCQATHRATLAGGPLKYDLVGSPIDCSEKVLLLRLQEIARQIRAESHRQLRAWSIVAAALFLLVALGLGIWSTLRSTREDVARTVVSSTRLTESARTTNKNLKHVQVNVEKAVELQAAGLKKVDSIDVRVRSLAEGRTLETIARKAGIDPEQVRQLLAQASSASVPILVHAQKLSDDGRHDLGYGLARFVAETALQGEAADYRSAADAFLMSATFGNLLAKAQATKDLRMQFLSDSEALAERGLDALGTLDTAAQKQGAEVSANLSCIRVECQLELVQSGEPHDAAEALKKSIALLDTAIGRDGVLPHQTAELYRLRATCLAERSNWVQIQESEELLFQATAECDRSLAILKTRAKPAVIARVLRARAECRLALSELIAGPRASAALEQADADCSAAMQLLSQSGESAPRGWLLVERGVARLGMAENPRMESEIESDRAFAAQLFKDALHEAEGGHDRLLARRAATGLLSACCRQDRFADAQDAMAAAVEYEAESAADILAEAEFARLNAADETSDVEDAAKLLNRSVKQCKELRVRYPRNKSPWRFAKASFALAECEWGLARLVVKATGRPQLWEFAPGRKTAIDIVSQLAASFPREDAPRVWARAKMKSGAILSVANQRIAAYGDALTVYSPEDDPLLWSYIVLRRSNLQLAEPKEGETRLSTAMLRAMCESLEEAAKSATRSHFPEMHTAILACLSNAWLQLAVKAADLENRQKAQSMSLRFAITARQQQDSPGNDAALETHLRQLVAKLKLNADQDAANWIDEEVVRLTQEIKGKAAD